MGRQSLSLSVLRHIQPLPAATSFTTSTGVAPLTLHVVLLHARDMMLIDAIDALVLPRNATLEVNIGESDAVPIGDLRVWAPVHGDGRLSGRK